MNYYTKDLILRWKILVYGQITCFFKWHNKRWDAYYEMKKFDKFHNTLVHVKTMDESDRSLILWGIPIKELKEAVVLRQLFGWFIECL